MAAVAGGGMEERGWRQWPDAALRTAEMVRRAAWAAMEHDALTVAQATAYSAMVALFPALIVAAALVAFAAGYDAVAGADGAVLRPGAAVERELRCWRFIFRRRTRARRR